MNVLGLQAFYYNHAAALVLDGKLDFFIEEEKVNRVKAQRDGFPVESVRAALEHARIGLEDVDEIAYPCAPWPYSWNLVKYGLASVVGGFTRAGWPKEPAIGRVSLTQDRVLTTLQFTPPFLSKLIRQNIRFGRIPGRIPKVAYVPHHRAHAASAFFTSGWDEAAILIVDGSGETESTTIWDGRGLDIRRLEKISFPNSLGEFYAAFTEFCGFDIYSQEGKLMGLAAYGGPDPALEQLFARVFRVEPEGYRVDPRYTIDGPHSFGYAFSDALVELFGEPRGRNGALTDRHRNIAWHAQDLLEKGAIEMAKKAVRLTGKRRLCLSGGVGMNCKMNGAVLLSGVVDDLYVLPASNDAGVALGAAMERARIGGDDPRFQLRHAYYGPQYDDAQIERDLKVVKAPYERLDVEKVVDLLTQKNVVGLYTGRNEFGARALGARSILADPRHKDMLDIVNANVKFREGWRPFAPVILAGHEQDWFVDGRESRYMMKAFQVRPEKAAAIPAVVHVDGTCRPQSITRDVNPLYHDIVAAFHRRTGVPILLNTSFNVRNEPIVCRPIEALRCYMGTGMDALVIGSFLLRKSAG
ncbi:MAG: carbamoyltransferase [Planctomycetes bacterium]|nr:carbamoyltransferase [Planctomycetota bacterium]